MSKTPSVNRVLVATGYVVPPIWAAVVAGNLTTLGYSDVASARVGGWGGPKGTRTAVATYVRSHSGGRWRTILRAPVGGAILGASASEDGVLVVEGPLADLPTAPTQTGSWRVVAWTPTRGARVVWRSPSGYVRRPVPDLATCGAYWLAVSSFPTTRGHNLVVLSRGRFGAAAASLERIVEPGAVLSVAVNRQGAALVEVSPGKARLVPPAAGAGLVVVSGDGTVLALPGGFARLNGGRLTAVGRVRAQWVGRTVGGAAIVGAAGDGLGGAVATVAAGRGRLMWSYGATPHLSALLSTMSENLTLTQDGAAGILLTGNGARQKAYALWVNG